MEFREIKGDGHLLEEEDDDEFDEESDEFEGEGEGEGDIYLEEICRDLGFFGGPTPLLMGLSEEEGNKGGLLGFFGSAEVASELAATIIIKVSIKISEDQIILPHIVI